MATAVVRPPRSYRRFMLVAIALGVLIITGAMLLEAGRERTGTAAVIAKLKSPQTCLAELERIATAPHADDQGAMMMIRPWVRTGNVPQRAGAMRALAAIGDAELLNTMRAATADPEPAIRIAALAAVAKLDGDAACRAAQERTSDRDPAVRAAAIAAAIAGDRGQGRAAGALAAFLDDNDPALRTAAADALAALPGDAALDAIAGALLHRDAEVRRIAESALAKRRDDILPRLSSRLRQGRPEERARAARLFGALGGTEAVPALLGLLDDGGKAGKNAAALDVELLGTVTEGLTAGGVAALPQLCRAVLVDGCDPVPEQVVFDVLRTHGRAAVPAMTEAVLAWKVHPKPALLARWIGLLGQFKDPACAPALARALAQGDPEVDAAVAAARSALRLPGDLKPDHDLLIGPAPAARPARLGMWPVAVEPRQPAAEVPDEGGVILQLEGALIQPGKDGAGSAKPLVLDLRRSGGAWQPTCVGNANRFNKRDHPGRVVGTGGGDAWKLDIELAVEDDMWVKGGFAGYTIELKRGAQGWTGSYSGSFNEAPVQGAVTVQGYALSTTGQRPPPPAPDEHPRLLLRRDHLAGLRERVRTASGRALMRALIGRIAADTDLYRKPVDHVQNWQSGANLAIGHGLVALLFDDPEHGRRAARLVAGRARTPPYQGEHGERLPGNYRPWAYAADLAWPWMNEEDRRATQAALAGWGGFCQVEMGLVGVLTSPGCWTVPGEDVLAILGKPGPFKFKEPLPPPPAVEVAAEDMPVDGQSPQPLTIGALSTTWSASKPQPPTSEAALVELATAPRLAETSIAGRALGLAPLPAEAVQHEAGLGTHADYLAFVAAGDQGLTLLVATIELAKETGVVPLLMHPFQDAPSRLWVGKRELVDDQAIILGPGRHRVCLLVRGRVARPTFMPFDVGRWRGNQRRQPLLHARWSELRDLQARTGEASHHRAILFQATAGIRRVLRAYEIPVPGKARIYKGHEVLDGGGPWPFVHALHMCFGQPLEPAVPLPFAGDEVAMHHQTIVFAMNFAGEPLRTRLQERFRSELLPKAGELDCLALVGALVNHDPR